MVDKQTANVESGFSFALMAGFTPDSAQQEILATTEGVLSVEWQAKHLIVRYSIMQTGLPQLQQQLQQLGIPLKQSRWQGIKAGLKCFTDDNLRAHAVHEHQCCGKPPKGM
ncbi:hypothetical protein [Amphritea pacifica]|uniref:Uncharacterized protein n=1 Tax=Amphritea pacifica TaxID=2811233 RepID=A0ABS2W3N3_9GAMM|nr:hypothetical protein [Amphritea pacifica]MBN0986312.1 hypothetical protein [Amphritea pacifica]